MLIRELNDYSGLPCYFCPSAFIQSRYMFSHSLQNILLAAAFSLTAVSVKAQKVQEPKITNEEWNKPYKPFRIAGNLYYVGTYDLACYLITTTEGNILINTGLAASDTLIKNNIETLGFEFTDTKILLTTQAHYDHMGAMAAIKEMTGAKMMVDDKDAAVLKDGGSSDYALGGNGSTYQPVTPDRLLHNGDTITLGNMQLVMLHHPGHTKGSSSFTTTLREAGRDYSVLIANMGSINPGVNVAFMPAFKEITQAYLGTLERQKQLRPDVWLSSHAPQFNLYQKRNPGDAYDPNRFVDPDGYGAKIQFYEKLFRAALDKDRANTNK